MSLSLLDVHQETHLHTALDDLESFIWVLVIVSIEIQLKRKQDDGYGKDFIRYIGAESDIRYIGIIKEGFHGKFIANNRRRLIPTSIRPLILLIRALFRIVDDSAADLYDLVEADGRVCDRDKFDQCIATAYERFIRTGLEALNDSDRTWEGCTQDGRTIPF